MKDYVKERRGHLVILPGGTTSKAQPLDKLVNRAFKKHMKDQWERWMISNVNQKSPSRGQVATWVSEAWKAVSPALIRKAFECTGVTAAVVCQNEDVREEEVVEEVLEEGIVCPIFQCPESFLSYDATDEQSKSDEQIEEMERNDDDENE